MSWAASIRANPRYKVVWLVHSTWNFLGHTWNNVSSCACPNSSERKNWKIGKAPVKGRYSDGLRTGELDASKYWRTWVQPWWRGGGWGACVSLISLPAPKMSLLQRRRYFLCKNAWWWDNTHVSSGEIPSGYKKHNLSCGSNEIFQ